MKARIIQYRFGPTAAECEENIRWILAQLDECDESLDAIVLPEGVHNPAPMVIVEKSRRDAEGIWIVHKLQMSTIVHK